jgi:ATP-dependent Lon protease
VTTTQLPVLFLTDLVVLPGMVIPIELDDTTRAAVDTARASSDGHLLLAPRLDDRYASYGVAATIVQMGRLAGGEPAAVLRAERRVRIGSGVAGPGSALWVEAHDVADDEAESEDVRQLAAEYKSLVIATLQRRDAWQVIDTVNRVNDPSTLADLAGYAPYLDDAQKLQLLETPSVRERLTTLIGWTKDHIAETEVNDKIADDVREGMEKGQREFLLRQQLNAIRKELGEDEPEGAQDYRSRVEEAALPEAVRTAALREVGKLERASDQSPESGYLRTWLDVILELPWGTKTDDSTDITAARAVLDADHHGLDDVKDRIVEYLAIRSRRAERGMEVVGGRGSGAVLALVGPPGVGKTSLGQSVARSLGRNFVRVALGGVRDEAEIRGHRRTYVGALPGRIVRAITEAGSMNPVVLLDEIDKVGSDYRGDPSAALLEVLDPAQNHTFRDHYLEVDLDLSDVVFLATANVLETIPQPLLDRMELVNLDGYTEDDKIAIARDYLLPKQLELAALRPDEVEVTDGALREIAADYTREPGVRQLERLLAKALRKAVTKLSMSDGSFADRVDDGAVEELRSTSEGSTPSPRSDDRGRVGGEDTPHRPQAETAARTTELPGDVETHNLPQRRREPLVITTTNLRDYLGRPRFTQESDERTAVPGVATGLAVTGMGGDVLFIEATSVEGLQTGASRGGLTLTGQLGDVMKESAQIALSYVRSHATQLGIADPSVLDRQIHIHVPAGAIPKDGPSAGVTMVTALTSMALGREVRGDVGMTGEVTLNGRVLPIGGVKQKLLAAQRAGLTTVFLPKRNEPDLDDVPAEVLGAIDIHLIVDVADLVRQAIEPAAAVSADAA